MMNRDIKVVFANLPTSVKAFTVLTDGYYTIVLNQNLSREQNKLSYLHELSHIVNNDYEKLDIQSIEANAHREGAI